ncbi:hypothetical protein E2C01_097562 [Portunus trituberculatus]|uniref:Uncharacterized protein n=1 Tax=Portunus trituberculatus TaxID=210409 RepID=A0A5B7K9Y3_PORTR|nr:hypothetical protein [Portunus trituberculatus]
MPLRLAQRHSALPPCRNAQRTRVTGCCSQARLCCQALRYAVLCCACLPARVPAAVSRCSPLRVNRHDISAQPPIAHCCLPPAALLSL